MMWSRIGRLAIDTIGFGMLGAASWIRRPSPPANNTTFTSASALQGVDRLARLGPAQSLVERTLVAEPFQLDEPGVPVEIRLREPGRLEGSEQLLRSVARIPLRHCAGKRPLQLPEVDAVAARIGAGSFGVLDLAVREGLADDLGELADPVVLAVRAHVERLVRD